MSDLLLRRREMMAAMQQGGKTYKLVNYTTDGTLSTAIKTDLQLFQMNWWKLEATFTLNSTFSSDFVSIIRCQTDGGSNYYGLLVQGGDSGRRSNLQLGDRQIYGDNSYLPVSTSVTYTLRAEWYNNVGGYQYLSDGTNYKIVDLRGNLGSLVTSPLCIAGNWDTSASPEAWLSGRFPNMTIQSLTLTYSDDSDDPYNVYTLSNYTINGSSNDFIDTELTLLDGSYEEVHINMKYHYTSLPTTNNLTTLNCNDETDSNYPGFTVRYNRSGISTRRPTYTFNGSGGDRIVGENLATNKTVEFLLNFYYNNPGKNGILLGYTTGNWTKVEDYLFDSSVNIHNKPLTIGGIYDSNGNIARIPTNCVIDHLKIMYK